MKRHYIFYFDEQKNRGYDKQRHIPGLFNNYAYIERTMGVHFENGSTMYADCTPIYCTPKNGHELKRETPNDVYDKGNYLMAPPLKWTR